MGGQMFKRTVFAATVLSLTAPTALAWDVSIDGPDVFGVTKVFTTEGNAREAIVVQCDSKDELFVALIFKKKEFEDVPTIPATLLFQINGATPVKLEATLRAWNDNYGGVVASGRVPELVDTIKAIQDASGKINAGYEALGNQASASFGSRGSTDAMQKIMKHCLLDGIAPAL